MTDKNKYPKGYCPHDGMTLIECDKCHGTEFKCFPQSIDMNAGVWCVEFTCVKCGHVVGINERRR